ncbi:MAG: CCA tRNA nucleotidyltransferase [Lachnospiraceae bacterium]|nr:CCA tRNA nucleotidyltransferase [Lachnospiraceae bacterium]
MKIEVPEKVKLIIDTLRRHGHEAYAVGGCVRDSVLGRTPNDWDITTSAKPEEVKAAFRRTIDTGIEHGTVTVMLQKEGFEVTTYRIDGTYTDGRHPDSVVFTSALSEDLLRRDFTINAMAYNDHDGLVDLYGGVKDLECRIIRCVGDPNARFDEDALRILRAVRFAAQLGFSIDSATWEAIKSHAEDLRKISAERIQVELVKLLTSPHPQLFRLLYESGITAVIMPEFDTCMKMEQHTPYHLYNVGEHSLKSLEFVPEDKVLRLTMLLHDIAKPEVHRVDSTGTDHFKGHAETSAMMAKTILKRLKFDNDTLDKVTKLIRFHDIRAGATAAAVRRAMYEIGPSLFDAYLAVQRADNFAKNTDVLESEFERLDRVEALSRQIIERGDPLSLKALAINGRDLLSLGIKGKAVGEVLESALMMVLEMPELNDHELLLTYAMQKGGLA